MPVQHPYRRVLNRIFGGELKNGAHNPDGQGCFLEVATIARYHYQDAADIEFRARHWSDSPLAAGLPDARAINDAVWSSDAARTRALTPVAIALWDWATWLRERKDRWLWIVAKRTWAEVVVPSIQKADLPPAQKDLWLHFGEETLPDLGSDGWYDLVEPMQVMPNWSVWSKSNQRWGFEALADRLPMFARIFTAAVVPPMSEADLASVAARCSDMLGSDKPLRKACLIWAEAAEESAHGG